jgi:16S rRNA (cytosine1402-N4)-methyltransferase
MSYSHTPVLLQEALSYLDPKPGENFVDATLGGGGYSTALLKKVSSKSSAKSAKGAKNGRVLSIDLDPAAREQYEQQLAGKTFQKNAVIAAGNFRDLDHITEHYDFRNISGIVADIGLSSYQLDQSGRGISFQKDEPLDMRFDPSSSPDAKFILNNYSLDELTRMFKDFGEEPHSRSIAKAIVARRETHAMHSVQDLVTAIQIGLPKPKRHLWQNAARRIFQAVRMAVNHELENLETFLPKAFGLLNPGGRMVVVSFHSLEDRLVKRFFAEAARGCICPPEFPYCKCGLTPQGKLLTRKPVMAGEAEQAANSRSIPAKLRAILKLH